MSKKSYYTKERGTEFSKSQLEEMFDEIRSVIDEFEQKFKLKAIKDINAMKRLTELDCYIAGIKIETIKKERFKSKVKAEEHEQDSEKLEHDLEEYENDLEKLEHDIEVYENDLEEHENDSGAKLRKMIKDFVDQLNRILLRPSPKKLLSEVLRNEGSLFTDMINEDKSVEELKVEYEKDPKMTKGEAKSKISEHYSKVWEEHHKQLKKIYHKERNRLCFEMVDTIKINDTEKAKRDLAKILDNNSHLFNQYDISELKSSIFLTLDNIKGPGCAKGEALKIIYNHFYANIPNSGYKNLKTFRNKFDEYWTEKYCYGSK